MHFWDRGSSTIQKAKAKLRHYRIEGLEEEGGPAKYDQIVPT